MKSRKKRGSRTGSIVALCVVLALTICLGLLGANGMSLPPRGLYKILPWLPSTNSESWPETLSLGLICAGACMWNIPPRRRKARKRILTP